MHQEEEQNGGFWPGYVAAVACLVLSLLLISAVMAITIMQLGVSVGQMMDAKEAAAMVAASKPLQTSPPLDLPAPVKLKQPTLELSFPKDAWRLDDAARTQLRAEVEKLTRQGVKGWTLTLPTHTNDSLKRRAAYLQLMAVRNVMLEAGVAGDQIDIRMVDAGPELEAQTQFPLSIVPNLVPNMAPKAAPADAVPLESK